MDPVLFGLMGFVIVGSIVALEMKDLLSSVIAVGVVGLGLSIVFLLLGAPDIAITQVVVEVLVVTVLIRACSRMSPERPHPRRGLPGIVAGVGLALVVVGFVVVGLAALPPFGTAEHPMSLWILANAPEMTGAANVVTAVLLDIRAYDTLGEATVILAAVVGTIAVLRGKPRDDLVLPKDDESIEEADPPTAPDLREVVHA